MHTLMFHTHGKAQCRMLDTATGDFWLVIEGEGVDISIRVEGDDAANIAAMAGNIAQEMQRRAHPEAAIGAAEALAVDDPLSMGDPAEFNAMIRREMHGG